jgi:trigger factor
VASGSWSLHRPGAAWAAPTIRPVRTTVEPLEGNKVKLSVELDEGEFDRAIDAAFRRIGREVRIPGFRPGKAPRRLLEARVGLDVARQEAIRDALPDYYERALKENDLEAIAPPEIDITAGKEAGPIAFDATVEIMPQVSVAGYGGLRVVLPSFAVSEDDVDTQVDRLREQYGELQAVSRPARDGDYVSMDRKVYRHGETVVAADDELYEIGSGLVGPELDENLRGARAGDILKFNAHHDEVGEVTFQVLVKEVRHKVLPDATDEWASEASEFESLAELRDNLREQIGSVRKLEAALTVRDKVIDALVELVDEEVPEALVGTEMERRLRLMAHRLEHQGADIAQYLEATGRSENDLLAELRAQSVGAVKADLGLRAVADLEGIDVTDAELNEEIVRIAEQQGKRPTVVRRELEDEDQLPAVLSGIRKTKALEWLINHTEFVDEEGRAIDRSELTPPTGAPAETTD